MTPAGTRTGCFGEGTGTGAPVASRKRSTPPSNPPAVDLYCRFLDNVAGVNSYDPKAQLQFSEGGSRPIYLQLVNRSQDTDDQGFSPPGRRYVPQAGATLQVSLLNLDQAVQVTKAAIQPFAGDASIWKIDSYPSDKLRGTVSLRLALTEGSDTTYALVQAGLLVRGKGG